MYNKIEMFGFADFYHRFSAVGLTIEEIFQNWEKYSKNPRDISDPIRVPKRLKEELSKVKPPAIKLMSVRKQASILKGVKVEQVNGKGRKRDFVEVRQWTSYVGTEMGFEPKDFVKILGWDRSMIYHQKKKAVELAEMNINYRNSLNELLKMFGCDSIIA